MRHAFLSKAVYAILYDLLLSWKRTLSKLAGEDSRSADLMDLVSINLTNDIILPIEVNFWAFSTSTTLLTKQKVEQFMLLFKLATSKSAANYYYYYYY